MGSVFIQNPLHDFGTNRVKGCAKVYGLTLFLHVSSIRGNVIFTGKENPQSMDWVKPSDRHVVSSKQKDDERKDAIDDAKKPTISKLVAKENKAHAVGTKK
ncbi:MAG: hypothetical protein GY874_17515, partial [Desulfobacteraceae bacterium]|nr:hypothetical protein [Desulfobacteraceae bacterium]